MVLLLFGEAPNPFLWFLLIISSVSPGSIRQLDEFALESPFPFDAGSYNLTNCQNAHLKLHKLGDAIAKKSIIKSSLLIPNRQVEELLEGDAKNKLYCGSEAIDLPVGYVKRLTFGTCDQQKQLYCGRIRPSIGGTLYCPVSGQSVVHNSDSICHKWVANHSIYKFYTEDKSCDHNNRTIKGWFTFQEVGRRRWVSQGPVAMDQIYPRPLCPTGNCKYELRFEEGVQKMMMCIVTTYPGKGRSTNFFSRNAQTVQIKLPEYKSGGLIRLDCSAGETHVRFYLLDVALKMQCSKDVTQKPSCSVPSWINGAESFAQPTVTRDLNQTSTDDTGQAYACSVVVTQCFPQEKTHVIVEHIVCPVEGRFQTTEHTSLKERTEKGLVNAMNSRNTAEIVSTTTSFGKSSQAKSSIKMHPEQLDDAADKQYPTVVSTTKNKTQSTSKNPESDSRNKIAQKSIDIETTADLSHLSSIVIAVASGVMVIMLFGMCVLIAIRNTAVDERPNLKKVLKMKSVRVRPASDKNDLDSKIEELGKENQPLEENAPALSSTPQSATASGISVTSEEATASGSSVSTGGSTTLTGTTSDSQITLTTSDGSAQSRDTITQPDLSRQETSSSKPRPGQAGMMNTALRRMHSVLKSFTPHNSSRSVTKKNVAFDV